MAQPTMDVNSMSKIQFRSYTYHFLFSAAKGCLLPYLTIYFRVLGLTATQVGILMGIGAFVTMISSACCTSCATKCHKRRLVLVGSTCALFLSYLVMMVLPPVNEKGALQFCQEHTYVYLKPENESLPDFLNTTYNLTTTTEFVMTTQKTSQLTTAKSTWRTTTVMATTFSTLPTTKAAHRNAVQDLKEDDLKVLHDLGINPQDLEGLTRDDISQIIEEIEGKMKASSTTARRPVSHRQGHVQKGHRRPERDVRAVSTNGSANSMEPIGSSGAGVANQSLVTSMWEKIYTLHEQLSQLRSQVFAALLAIVIITSMFGSPADQVSDDIWFDFLDSADMLEKYGQHRSWASLGLLIFPIIPAAIVVHTPCLLFGSILNIKIHFITFGCLMLCCVILSFTYPIFRGSRKVHRKTYTMRGFRILFTDCHAALYTLTIIVVGMLDATLSNFLFWQVQDLGGSEMVMGAAVAIFACGQIIMYIMYRWLICKLSHGGTAVLGILSLASCFVFYSFAWMPWVIVPGELIRGMSMTLIWNTLMLYPDFRLNPFVMDRSALHVMTNLYFGFGIGSGSVLSGYMADLFGLRIVFQGGGVLVVAWAALFALSLKCVAKKAKVRYAKLLQDDADSHSDDDSASFDEDDWLEIALKHNK